MITTGGSKIDRSPTSPTTDWKVDRSPISGMNCLGRLSRDSGQTRVPEPPHMITGRILLIRLSMARKAPNNQPAFCAKPAAEATPALYASLAARVPARPAQRNHSAGERRQHETGVILAGGFLDSTDREAWIGIAWDGLARHCRAERTPSCFSTGVGVVSASRRHSRGTTIRFAIGNAIPAAS